MLNVKVYFLSTAKTLLDLYCHLNCSLSTFVHIWHWVHAARWT